VLDLASIATRMKVGQDECKTFYSYLSSLPYQACYQGSVKRSSWLRFHVLSRQAITGTLVFVSTQNKNSINRNTEKGLADEFYNFKPTTPSIKQDHIGTKCPYLRIHKHLWAKG